VQYDQVQTGFNEVGSAIGQTQDQLAQGFAGTAKQSDMMSGFNDLQNQGSDTQSMVGAGFNATNNNLVTGFNDAADRMNSGFQQTQGLMSDAQSAILGGQNDLSSDLSNVSDNLDTYYGGLAGGQEDIQGRVGNLQSDFTDLNDQYTQDTTLANQTRADIQTGVDNTGQQLGEQIGQFRGAAEANQSRLMEAVGGQSATPAPTTAAQTSNQAATSQTSPVEAVRTALERNAGNMAPNIAQQFMEVAQAFDSSGNLIRSAQEPTGNLVRREMDRAGQMRVRRSAPNGQLMADNVVDARSVFQQALNMI
jgi:hypothetical protein